MASITFGGIELTSKGPGLTVGTTDDSRTLATLNNEQLIDLIDFLTSLPDGQLKAERQNFRVPISIDAGTDLSVELTFQREHYPVVARNISAAGIFVAIDPNKPVALANNDEVKLSLQYNGVSENVRAVVRRIETHGYGLLFIESSAPQADECELTQVLKIVMELQRAWLKKKSE